MLNRFVRKRTRMMATTPTKTPTTTPMTMAAQRDSSSLYGVTVDVEFAQATLVNIGVNYMMHVRRRANKTMKNFGFTVCIENNHYPHCN